MATEAAVAANNDLEEINSGYSDDATETPVRTEQPVEEIPEAPAVDPMAEIMARFEKMEASQSKLAGHIGSLTQTQKALAQVVDASRAAAQTVASAPSQAEVKDALQDPAEWATLKEDFPEWAAATEKYLDARLSNTPGNNKGLDAAEIEKIVASIVDKRVTEKERKRLDRDYKTWVEDVNSPQFNEWFKTQEEGIRNLADSPDVDDARDLLKIYYAAIAKPKAAVKPAVKATEEVQTTLRQKRFSAAVTPKGTGGHENGPGPVDEIAAGYYG